MRGKGANCTRTKTIYAEEVPPVNLRTTHRWTWRGDSQSLLGGSSSWLFDEIPRERVKTFAFLLGKGLAVRVSLSETALSALTGGAGVTGQG